MKRQALLDTNVLIYYFNGIKGGYDVEKLLKNSFNISIITQIEFLGWSGFADDAKLREEGESFLSYATVFDLTGMVADTTVQLRQTYRIKTPDAIIAATALVYHMDLATYNTKDFQISDLRLLAL